MIIKSLLTFKITEEVHCIKLKIQDVKLRVFKILRGLIKMCSTSRVLSKVSILFFPFVLVALKYFVK
jgi:hypothetical protein